jgi:NADH-quinone oxidoreductase subunit M
MMVSLFASLGLPGLNGFVGEFLIFKGGFFLAGAATGLAIIGLLVSAVFILTMIDRLFHGPLTAALARFPDLSRTEILLVLPPIALMVLLGVCPQLLTGLIDDTVRAFVANLAF